MEIVHLGLLLPALSISFSVMVVLYYCVEIAAGTFLLAILRYAYGLTWFGLCGACYFGLCCACYFGFALQAMAIPSTRSRFRIIWVPVFTSIASYYWQHHITSILMRYLKLLLYPP
eukprot:642839_1